MVMIRSSLGIKAEKTLRVVVLPEPVPPEMTMFSLAWTQALHELQGFGRDGAHTPPESGP